MRYLMIAAALTLCGCDGGPDEDYCEPCVGEVLPGCEDICSGPKGDEE